MSFTLEDDEDEGLPVEPSPTLTASDQNPPPPLTAPTTSFNIDEFLDAPAQASIPEPAAATAIDAAATNDSFAIDDFLDSEMTSSKNETPTDTAKEKNIEPTPVTSPPGAAVPGDDFLSWLDGNDSSKALPTSTSSGANSQNVFTDSTEGSSSVLPPIPPLSGNSQKSPRNLKYETDLLKIISSGFPDIPKLQSLIAANGYIPRDLRGQVWCLLLSGTCSEDQEADFWQSTGNELPNHSEVVSDCNAVIDRCRRRGLSLPSSTLEQARRDMVDILVLYCVRRTIPYKPLYCDILAPMLVTARPLSRMVASSCFYSLCSEFIPVVNLPVMAQEKTSEKLHQIFRLLVKYHYPALCSHLDKVLEGWEKKTNSISAAMANLYDAAARDRAEMDELERDFGFSLPESSAADSSPPDDSSASPGVIPENWLYCIFGGSIPLDLSCWIWDWVLSSGDKFSGVYAVVALLGLYSEALQSMSGPQIREWIQLISNGSSDTWFTELPIKLPKIEGMDQADDGCNNLSVNTFIRGWIHAAEAIRHITPTSFQMSLNSVEKWGGDDHCGGRTGSQGLDSSNGGDISLDRSTGATGDITSGSSVLQRLKRLSVQMQKPPSGTSSEGIRGRFSRVLNAADGAVEDGKNGDNSFSGHRTPLLSDICLWANVAEVIPCLCSSSKQRAAVSSEMKVMSSFKFGAYWNAATAPSSDPNASSGASPRSQTVVSDSNSQTRSRSNSQASQDSIDSEIASERGGEGFVIPLLAREKDQPFFFGIDCRGAANEIGLGKFPKAFCLDPEDLKDSYLTSTILRTLEPLAHQFHFCIIGVGEEFFVHRATTLANKTPRGGSLDKTPTVDMLRAEYYEGVASVLKFFEKRKFKHVSFLEGGFTSAARYLMREECPYSISSSLVDIDAQMLDNVFGTGTASAHLHVRRAMNTAAGTSGAAVAPTTPAASGFLSSLSKADIFAGPRDGNIRGDVVEVTPPAAKPTSATGASGILSFMSSMKASQSGSANTSDAYGDKGTSSDIRTVDSTSVGNATTAPGASMERIDDLKSKMSIFGSNTLASLRRVSQSVGAQSGNSTAVSASSSTVNSTNGSSDVSTRPQDKPSVQRESSAFVIDDEDEEDEQVNEPAKVDSEKAVVEQKKSSFITRVGGVIRSSAGVGSDPSPSDTSPANIARLQGGGLVDVDSDKIGVSKTEAEKAQALAMHKLAGMMKGDQLTISRESLPGALLFPAKKVKTVPVSKPEGVVDNSNPDDGEAEEKEVLLPRYIVVTKERVLVLDSGGAGVGATATVKSNHHLTELIKLTFKKRDPESLTLYVVSSFPGIPERDDDGACLDEKQRGGPNTTASPKQKQYRVSKRDELVEVLQKYMKRFR